MIIQFYIRPEAVNMFRRGEPVSMLYGQNEVYCATIATDINEVNIVPGHSNDGKHSVVTWKKS